MFNPYLTLKRFIIKSVNKMVRPSMVGGFLRHDGVYLKNTRISNKAFIGAKDNLLIEDHVFIGHFNFVEASNKLTIKEGCQITNFVTITTHSSHISIRLYGKEYGTASEPVGYLRGEVYLGEYSYIGPHSTIMPNTHLGKGCIVTAYSYVKGVFPDFSIIAGNPAQIVGDTRKIDESYLEKFPELRRSYDEWANEESENENTINR